MDAEPVVEPSEPKMKGYSVPENKETIDYEPRQRDNEKKPRTNNSNKMSQINKTRTLIRLACIYIIAGVIRSCLSSEVSFIEMLSFLFGDILWIFSICGTFIFEEKMTRIPAVILSILVLFMANPRVPIFLFF